MTRKGEQNNRNFEIIFLELKGGECPVQDFLDSLDIKMAVKLYGLMEILEEHGNFLREPYSKHLGDGIFELRAKVGTDISRTLYFFYEDKRIIMTNGYIKKTQKTPRSVLRTAKTYRKIFLNQQEAKK
jgi:phage-related protein